MFTEYKITLVCLSRGNDGVPGLVNDKSLRFVLVCQEDDLKKYGVN